MGVLWEGFAGRNESRGGGRGGLLLRQGFALWLGGRETFEVDWRATALRLADEKPLQGPSSSICFRDRPNCQTLVLIRPCLITINLKKEFKLLVVFISVSF